MTEPTDAELKAMWQLHAADIGGIFCYARAVLAKWGQPAQAAEPVAVVVPCYTPSGKRVALYSAKQDLPIGTKLYAAPKPSYTAQAAEPVAWYEYNGDLDAWFLAYSHNPKAKTRPLVFGDTAPQPVAREPLTDEQREAIWQECRYDNGGWEVDCWEVIDAVERMHSIKGGQHGAYT